MSGKSVLTEGNQGGQVRRTILDHHDRTNCLAVTGTAALRAGLKYPSEPMPTTPDSF
jgi:hypothetical protein